MTYTIKDIMRILSISKSSAYRLANTDGFPCVRIGKLIRIEKDAFENWMRRR